MGIVEIDAMKLDPHLEMVSSLFTHTMHSFLPLCPGGPAGGIKSSFISYLVKSSSDHYR